MVIRHDPRLISALFLLLAVAPANVVARGSATTRPWPLPIAINLTSSFAEYRSGHLHAGLDIKTYGRNGVPCIAVGDGHVSRLRASPDGYGKAVYLKLEGGEIAVYAHLSEFAPALEEALFEEQKKEGRYRVDIYFDRDRFPVMEGEVVAYTGRTGTSAPHLHFEFRDRDQNPINPLSHGWTLKDREPPGVRGVTWIPLDTQSRIDGACRARDLKVLRTGPGTFAVVDTVHVRGRVGIGAHIVDRLNSASGRLAPYRVELIVDGVRFTTIEMERFSYGHTGEVELAYDMERVRRFNRHYLLLFRRQGESMWNRTFQDDGVIEPDQLEKSGSERIPVHTAVVRTVDRAGNVSVTSIPFVSGRPGPAPASAAVMDGAGPQGCYFFGDLMSVERMGLAEKDRDLLAAVADRAGSDDFQLTLRVNDLHAQSLTLAPFDDRAHPTLHLFAVRRGEDISREVESLRTGISMNERSLYSDAFVYLSRGPAESAKAGELTPGGSTVVVGPVSLTLKRSAGLWFELESPVDGREAVYALNERKKEWQYNDSEVRGDTVYAGIRSPGIYGVFVDTRAPSIARPVVAWRKSYATGEEYPEIAIGLTDDGSGIDPDVTEVRVNGERQIARWDAFTKKMFVPVRGERHSNTYEVSVTAVDRVGNRSRLEGPVSLVSRGTGRGESEDDAQ